MNLTTEEIAFLKDLAQELNTQDNRATAAPYYYTVRKAKRIVGMDVGISDKTVFVISDGDYQEFEDQEKAIEHLMEDEGLSSGEAEAYCEMYGEEYGVLDTHEESNVFLTYKGFLEHMHLNGHNYSRSCDSDKYQETKEVHSYVQHAFRNPEMAQVIKILKKLGESL